MKVPYKIAPRRAGDIDTCYSDPTKAKWIRLGSWKRFKTNVYRFMELYRKKK